MKKALLFFITLLGTGFYSQAQQTFSLSLQEAIDLAKENRPALLLSRKDVESSTLATKQTRAGFTPTLSFDADFRYNTILQTIIVPDFNNPSLDARRAVQFGTPLQAAAGLTLNQAIIDPSKRENIRSSEVNQEIALNTDKLTEVDLVEAVTASYYQVLLSEAIFGYSSSSYIRAEALLKDLENRFKEQRALPTDVSTALIAKKNAELTKQIDQENILLNIEYLLVQIGLSNVNPEDVVLTDGLTAMIKSMKFDSDAESDPSLRPEYRETILNQKLAQTNAEFERKSTMPTLDLVGYLGANGFGDRQSNIIDVTKNWFGLSYLGLQFSVPFLDLTRSSRISIQTIAREKAAIQEKAQEAQIKYEVKLAATKLSQAEMALDIQAANLEIAKSNLGILTDRFDKGRSLLSDVIDAENLLKQAERDQLQAIYDVLTATLNLKKAKGTLVEMD